MQSLLANSPMATPNHARRSAFGWVISVLGPVALATFFSLYVAEDSEMIGLMLFMSIPVAAAIMGGLWPSLLGAALAAGGANFALFPPTGTFEVHGKLSVYTLLIFLLVAVAVSVVVSLATKRSAQARLARFEADALIALAEDTLRGGGGVSGLLEHTRRVFGLQQVWLAQSEQRTWVELAATTPASAATYDATVADYIEEPEEASEPRPRDPNSAHARGFANSEGTRALFGNGLMLGPEQASLFEVFARQISEVWDLSEMRSAAAEAEARSSQEELRVSLLSALSHDLRTPLSGAKTAIQTLRSAAPDLDPDDREYLHETIEGSIDELTRILRNLLDQTRIRSGTVKPLVAPVSLDEIIPAAVDHVAAAHPEAARITLDLPEHTPLIRTDAGLLERIIANLLENAVRHGCPPGAEPPVVSVSQTCPHKVDISVIDHGPGLAATAKDTMFEAFQRHGDVPRGNGLGLGLAVAQGLSKALDSGIEVADTPGGGLTMTLRLAVAPESQCPPVTASLPADSGSVSDSDSRPA